MFLKYNRKKGLTYNRAKHLCLKIARNKFFDSVMFQSLLSMPSIFLPISTIKGHSIMGQMLAGHPDYFAPYFDRARTFMLFLSTSRSGHSIMAHLLNAHPEVLICDELGAISYFKAGFTKDQVFSLIKYQDYIHICKNRKKGGYNYKVDGFWQNSFDKHPVVLGDAKGARSIRLFGCNDDCFLDELRKKLQMPIRVIVHIRNPFDAITTQVRKRGVSLQKAVTSFIERERMITVASKRFCEEERLVQRHEDVIAEPEIHFARMFSFMGVKPLPEIVAACASKIWKKPNITRTKIDWPEEEVFRLKACLQQSHLFRDYLDR